SVLTKMLNGTLPTSREESKVISDLKNGQWLNEKELTVVSLEEFKQQAKELLNSGRYDEIWHAALKREPLIPIFEGLINRHLTKLTLQWKLKKLLSWAKGLGILPKQKYLYTSKGKKDPSLFT